MGPGVLRMIATVLALTTPGCLITDPILEAEDGGNTNPEFFLLSPDNEGTVFISNTNNPIVFTARARDLQTDEEQLYYEWTVDNGSVLLEGPDTIQFSTSGAALGPGLHSIQVLVTDDGQPTGFVDAEWQVQVQ